MGGRALKNTYTRRYSKQEFETVSNELLDKIKVTFDRANTPLYYHNKETFGDIDIIVDTDYHYEFGQRVKTEDGFIREYIEDAFKPNEIFHNGNCYSFDYKEVQVDFMCIPSEDYNSNYHYLAFNDLGNYIGRIAHRLGLKYGQEGLWYNHYINDQNVGKVMISKDYGKIFKFLDLDYGRWLEGFDELEDTFKYVTTSKYFDTDMFQLDRLNRINRERNLKRVSYMLFLDWINDVYPHKEGKMEPRGGLFKAIEKAFPDSNFMIQIKEYEYKISRTELINVKFNGGIIMRKYGFKGKEIGDALTGFREYADKVLGNTYSLDEFIIDSKVKNIYSFFEDYLKLKTK